VDEHEWAACGDPGKMLRFLGVSGKMSDRRARLFACAAVRRVWQLLTDERRRRAVEVAEHYADGSATLSELLAAQRACRDAPDSVAAWAADAATNAEEATRSCSERVVNAAARERIARESARCAVVGIPAGNLWSREVVEGAEGIEASKLLVSLRDIFANPFRPLPPIPASMLQWNEGLVRRLAAEAYEHRLLPSGHLDPERLAVLADALEEAGADAGLVEHLRGPGLHVRGCHAVDLLTGREMVTTQWGGLPRPSKRLLTSNAQPFAFPVRRSRRPSVGYPRSKG
jgi:hypothetical protein